MMKIVNFGQVVDLENGQGMINQFTVLTPGGERISIVTDEGTLNQLVELATMVPSQPRAHDIPGRCEDDWDEDYAPPGRDEEEESRYEDYDPTASDPGESYDAGDGLSRDAEPVMGVVAEEIVQASPEAAQRVQELGGGTGHKVGQTETRKRPVVDEDGFMVVPRGRTVQADEKGYPIVAGAQPVQEEAEEEPDEDGTQI